MPLLDNQRWHVVGPYLEEAMEMSPEQRFAWLGSLGSADPALAADLAALLDEHDALSRERFLEGDVPLAAERASLVGQTVGAYTVETLIGQGGMGSVWLARRSDGRFEGTVAIKFLNTALLGPAGEDRFRREGSILARLTHPQIARLNDAGVSSTGQPYLVLEHIAGTRIDQYCDDNDLDINARIVLFLNVLDAVAHAHANLIVHRDLKPSNVLVTTDGHVKLLDFGIAKLIEDDGQPGGATVVTREAGWAMTPLYAAPEQLRHEQVTTATDVYSLGVLLYVLLTGRHPAGDTQSPVDLMKAIVETEPPRLSGTVEDARTSTIDVLAANAARRGTTPDRLRRTLRGDLDTIVAKALKKAPADRYASVTALADDLCRYLDQQPISARPDSLAYRTAKFAERHTRALAAATGVALLLASLIVFYTTRLAKERDRARLEADKATKVADLLTGLLTGSDPYRDPGEPTVRAILDAGAERVNKELSGQPELQAEMLNVIGRTYLRLNREDKARPLLEQALAVGRRSLGEHPRVARSLNDLGVLLREKGDYAAAQPYLEESLAMRRRLLGNEHADVAVTLVELGRLYADRGMPERAEPLFLESLAIRRKVLGEEDRETAVSLGQLGLLLWRRGDLDKAEPLLRQSLAISQKTLGAEHPNVASSLNNLALVLADRKDFAAAEAMFRQALALHRKTNTGVTTALNNLSYPLREQKKYDEAIAVLDEAIAIEIAANGDQHPVIATFKQNLARVNLARGNPARAESLLREVLTIRHRLVAADDWRTLSAESMLGEALTGLRRYDEAEAVLLHASQLLKDGPGARGRDFAATRRRLVTLYEAQGHPEKAAPYRTSQK
jgi:eukaryotic-like serine/threonine-protein kinase